MRLLGFLPLVMLLAGCASMPDSATTDEAGNPKVPPYAPMNIYRQALPSGFSRVAVLPMVASPELGTPASLKSIQDAMVAELVKSKVYEVVVLESDTLRGWIGKGQLDSLEEWPFALKTKLQEQMIDGVMVMELTGLKGYPPLAMGVKSRLVGVSDGVTYWACNEYFDAAMKTVAVGAKSYAGGKNKFGEEISPTRFAHYASSLLWATLPTAGK